MKGKLAILPKGKNILKTVGENIRLARLRRKLSAEQVAERASISRSLLWRIERGNPSVSVGALFHVLLVLGLEKDLLRVAVDDALGRKLQDAGLTTKKRAPKKKNTE